MGDAPAEVKIRHIGNCLKADPAYGEGVAKALRIAWKAPKEKTPLPGCLLECEIYLKDW